MQRGISSKIQDTCKVDLTRAGRRRMLQRIWQLLNQFQLNKAKIQHNESERLLAEVMMRSWRRTDETFAAKILFRS